jgi:hypothetical protein
MSATRYEEEPRLPRLKEKRPLVKPGVYVARTASASLVKFKGQRDQVEIGFDLYESADDLGTGVAPVTRGVPGFFNVTNDNGRKVGDASKYARVLGVLFGIEEPPAALRAVIGHAVEVEVVTVDRDSAGKPKDESRWYSKVAEVLRRA